MQTRSSQPMWRTTLQALLLCCFLSASLVVDVQAGQVPDGLSKQDWSSIQRQVMLSKYKAFEKEDGSFTSSNIANGWHIGYGTDGRTSLTPYKYEESAYQISLKLNSIGYRSKTIYEKPQKILSNSTRLTYQWSDNVKEVWTNSSNRLEQWFEIQQRPTGSTQGQQLTLQLELTTDLQVAQNGTALNFANKISYNKLKVWDSTGAEMPARMHLQDNNLSLVIDDSLAMYPLTIDPSFQQQAYLKASNTDANDRFGHSISISGDTLVVGAYYEDSNATGVGGDETDNSAQDSGAAYVFTRAAGVWSQQAYLKASNAGASDAFGFSVAISGDTLVVGARSEASNATGVNGDEANNLAINSGSAYVFTRTANVWSQQAYLKASNTDGGDWFGWSAAISGDALVIGARDEDSNATGVDGDGANNLAEDAGAAYVFTRTAGVWSQQAYLKASNTDVWDEFGWSVAISGETVMVGTLNEDSNATGVDGDDTDNSASFAGAAYVFTRTTDVWSQQAYLKASNTEVNDLFGSSVAVSGDTLVVGARGEASNATGVNGDETDNSARESGAAYIFTRTTDVWSQQAYLKASNTDSQDNFGFSAAISGDTLVVGAFVEDSNATGVDGDETDNSAIQSGAAYVFTRTTDVWSQQAYLKASNTNEGDAIGQSIAISGDTIVVGSENEESNATGVDGDQADNSADMSGAAYVFNALAVVKTDQTITDFVATPSTGVVNGSSTLSSTGGASGNPVVFGSSTLAVCTVAGSTVTYVTAGTCTVTADQAGDATYNPAPQVTLNIGVGLTNQAITNFVATPSTGVVFGTSVLSATGGASGNPVVFGSSTMAVCTVAGSTVSYVTAGTCTVTADQAGNATYNAAPQVTLDITVAKADQTISGLVANPATGIAGGTSSLSATASSGLTVSFGSNTTAVCTVADTTVTHVTAGTCTVTADQAGDAIYNAAPQVTLDIIVAKAEQTISGLVADPATGIVGGTSTLSATASSGLAVTFGSNTPTVCTAAGTTVSYLVAGTCIVTANQAGDANYNPAPQVTVDIVVSPGDQTISSFAASPGSGFLGGSSALSATASSGLPVTFAGSTAAVCSVTGNTVTYIAAGMCAVTADQAGDATYNPTTQVTLDINVTEPPLAIPNVPIPTLSLWGLVTMFLILLGIGGMIVRRKTPG
jgi:hypothetical protein